MGEVEMSEQDARYPDPFTAWIMTREGEQLFLDDAFAAGVAHGRAAALAEMEQITDGQGAAEAVRRFGEALVRATKGGQDGG